MVDRELRAVRDRIELACRRSGRKSDEIELVLVTKGVGHDRIQAVYDLGHRSFGENKVQELTGKRELLPKDIKWHFIGHLQTNKAKFLVGQVHLIHSCDRIEILRELDKRAVKGTEKFRILIQVNASSEATKHGFAPSAVEPAMDEIKSMNGIETQGLMTMGPNTQDEKQIRAAFSKLRSLRDRLKTQFPDLNWHYLSMGMSSDFGFAIEEGANLLRIGTAVFGERK